MKVLEIEGCSIAKVESKIPFIASNNITDKTSYEWFYFEIIHEKSHIVLILSIKDCFHISDKASSLSSVYFTWHLENKLVSYSYSMFNQDNAHYIQNGIQGFIIDKDHFLELWIPDFSLEKYVHLKIHAPSINFTENIEQPSLLMDSKKEHFWQFLSNSEIVGGYVETIYLPSQHQKKFSNSTSAFHDVLLKNKLKKTPPYRVHFKNTRIYSDHNFGFQPIYEMKDEWCWWHIENKHYWEVSYFFPKLNKSFFISNNTDSTDIRNHDGKNLIIEKKFNFFLFFAPKKILSEIIGILDFNTIIECAPFYLRAKSKFKKNVNEVTSTIEFLIPKRVSNSLNKILMSARQIKVNKVVDHKDQLESFLSFEEICRSITKNNGKSFFLASFVISKIDRDKSYFIYSICRIIDDATDENENSKNNILVSGSSFSKNLLDILWDKELILTTEFIDQLKNRLSYCSFYLIDDQSTLNFIKKAQKEIIYLQLEKSFFEELVAGQLMDENFVQPKNFSEFYLYCYRVAGVVGLIMTKIFYVHDSKKALKAAEHLGIAMQITNILRDIKEDFEMGRIYIPLDSCVKNNICIEQAAFSDLSFKQAEKIKLVQDFSQKAIYFYNSAIIGIPYISKFRYRFCVRLMCAIYSGILSKIIQNNLLIFKQRTVVSRFEKFVIFFKVVIGLNPLYSSGIKMDIKNQEIFENEKI